MAGTAITPTRMVLKQLKGRLKNGLYIIGPYIRAQTAARVQKIRRVRTAGKTQRRLGYSGEKILEFQCLRSQNTNKFFCMSKIAYLR